MFFSQKTNPLAAALDYAASGYPVFPMLYEPGVDGAKGQKRPLTPHGFSDATTDPDTIATWWRDQPHALIGVLTGCISKLFVVDVDSEEANETWLRFADHHGFDPKQTAWEKTPHGYHYYYQYPEHGRRPTLSANVLGLGIETKGEGGSIIISPSQYTNERGTLCCYAAVHNVEIQKLPGSFFEFIQTLPAYEDQNDDFDVSSYPNTSTTTPEGLAFLEDALRRIREAKSGDRHKTFLRIGVGIARAVMSGTIALGEARKKLQETGIACGLGYQEVVNIIDWSFARIAKTPQKKTLEDPKPTPSQDIKTSHAHPSGFVKGNPDAVPDDVDENTDEIIDENIGDEDVDAIDRIDEERYTGIGEANSSEKNAKSAQNGRGKRSDVAATTSSGQEKCVFARLPEFPIDEVPLLAQEVIKNVANVYNVDMWMPFAAILKNIASLVGANYVMKFGPYKTPAHQWIMLVCSSGSGKSTVTRAIFEPVERLQSLFDSETQAANEEYEKALEAYEQQKREVRKKGGQVQFAKPKPPRAKYLYVNDVTTEKLVEVFAENPGGVVRDHDEISTWIRGFNKYKASNTGSEKAEALSMYEGGSIRVQRVKNGKEVVAVPHAWLSVYGTVQPDVLPTLITEEDFSSGFLQRFLFICPDEMLPRPVKNYELNTSKIYALFASMLKWPRLDPKSGKDVAPVEVELEPAAEECLNTYLYELQNEAYFLSLGKRDSRRFQLSRSRRWMEQCTRLVFALHCLNSSIEERNAPAPVVPLATVCSGIKIFEALTEHCRFAWSRIEEKIFDEKPVKKYLQFSDVSIIPFIADMMMESQNGKEMYFSLERPIPYIPPSSGQTDIVPSETERQTCYDALLERIEVSHLNHLDRDITKGAIYARLKEIGFTEQKSAAGSIFSINKSKFDFYVRNFMKKS